MGELLAVSRGFNITTIPEDAPEQLFNGMLFRRIADQQQIGSQAARVGGEISGDYRGKATKESPLVCLNILKGALPWCRDVTQNITPDVPFEVVDIRASSYGGEMKSSGTVKIEGIDPAKIANRLVVMMDDVYESGNTALALTDYLLGLGAASIAGAYAFNKTGLARDPRLDSMTTYVGFEVLDPFLVGYGMDINQEHRDLPDVWQRVDTEVD